MEREERYRSAGRPARCPRCGSDRIAEIAWGDPAGIPDLGRRLREGSLVLGGICVRGEVPAWRCQACGTAVYRAGGDPPAAER